MHGSRESNRLGNIIDTDTNIYHSIFGLKSIVRGKMDYITESKKG